MHFCPEELFAILAVLPFGTALVAWLRAWFRRRKGA